MTSKMFCSFIIFFLCSVAVSFSEKSLRLSVSSHTNDFLVNREDSQLNFTKLIGKYGYLSEQHEIVTEDGYILTVFRIVHVKNCRGKFKKTPVVLMHGLLQSSDSWIDSGPGAGLAYLIADACHDLWVGNARGNYYSRAHLHLDPDIDAAYWQFSSDEIAYYDVPALIDYVLNNTDANKLNYVGFSQGAGTFFAMCSERPQYCNKVDLMVALAPATRHINTKSPIFNFIMKLGADLEKEFFKMGINEILKGGGLLQMIMNLFCQKGEEIDICRNLLLHLDSVNPIRNGSITYKTIRTLAGHFPAGTSVHNIAKYGQMLTSTEYVKFDYGKKRNFDLYGSETPPRFNLDAVTVPVLLIYGINDAVVDVRDLEWLVSKLPRVAEMVEVSDPLWSHLDFTYSERVAELVFPKVNKYLLKNRIQFSTLPLNSHI